MIRFADSYRIPGNVRILYILIGLMVLSFWVTHNRMNAAVIHQVGGVIPAAFSEPGKLEAIVMGTQTLASVRPPALLTVFWSMFLHGGWLHLLTNLLWFYLLGRNVEAFMGPLRFAFFFLTCGAAASLAEVVYDLGSTVPIIGASGAISGLLGAYLVLFPHHQFRLTIGDFRSQYHDLMIPFKVLFALWILYQLFMTMLPPTGQAAQVAVFAHIGGFVCGMVLAKGRGTGGRDRRRKFKVVPGGPEYRGTWGVD